MLKIFYGNTGTGKSWAMMEQIRQKAAEGRQICVIVPDQFTFEYERMLYDHLGCRLYNRGNTEVWSFSRLTRDIFGKMRAPEGAPADSTAKTAVLYTVIKDAAAKNQLVYYGKQAKKPSFTATASTMLSELIHSGVTPEKLAEIITHNSESATDKLSDILTIYTDYTGRLAASGLRDSLFDMQLAASGAEKINYFGGKYLFIDEFKSFTGDQYEMIRAMLSGCEELTVCMTSDGRISGGSPFASAEETCGSLMRIARDTGAECSRIFFSENRRYHAPCLFKLTNALTMIPAPVCDDSAEEITIVKAPDLYAECSYICAKIRELVSDGKYRYSDIAVLSRAMNDDISVLSAHFKRYDIPYYSDKKPSVSHKPLMLMVTSALELAAAKSISTEVLLRYAKTGLTGITDDEIYTLENFCYKWDIDGDMWNDVFPKDKDEPQDEAEGICESIKNRLLAPIYELREKCTGKSGADICAAVRSLIVSTNAEERLINGFDENSGATAVSAEDAELMRENRRICEELDGILSSLENAFRPPEGKASEKISLSDFREIFMLAASGITLSAPPTALDGVAAQQSDLARLSNPKIVFVMHANDGTFPFVPSESTTFSEAERELFKKAGSDLSGSMKKRLTDERFNAFKAVCAPSEQLYISYSAADSSGKTLYPSEYIGKIKKSFPKCREIDAGKIGLLFYCRTEQAAYTAAVENYNAADSSFVTVRKKLEENPLYRSRFAYLDSIDGKISAEHKISDGRIMERLYGGKSLNISASRFDDYCVCPFKYYCITGLKIRPLLKNGLTAMNWGNAVHACMKEIMETYSKGDFIELTRSQLSRAVTKATKKYIRDEMSGGFGKSASFPVYLRIMKENTLRALVRLKDELKGSEFTPDAFELAIGKTPRSKDGKHADPITITCGDGHSVNFFGTADRVDLYDNGTEKYIRIIDYKTGAKSFSLDQIENGINLQMFLYLFSLTDPENGLYQGCKPAGALYFPVRFPLLEGSRSADPGEIEANVNESLRMVGEILDSGELVDAMEKIGSGESGKYIPAAKDEDGSFTADSSLLSEEGFEYIKSTSEMLMKDMCESVYGGNVPASPLKAESMTSNCDRCDYRGICVNYPDIKTRPLKKSGFGKKGKD